MGMIGAECETTFQNFILCEEMFGTTLSSMYTLFQVLSLESWSMEVSRPILREKPYFVLFFLCYLYITTFGLLNIVTGVIVDHTLQASQNSEKEWKAFRRKQQKDHFRRLHILFDNVHTNGNGKVGLHEFLDMCKTQEAINHFYDCNLRVHPPEAARQLFEILDYEEAAEMSLDDIVSRTLDLLDESAFSSRTQCGQLIEFRRLVHSWDETGFYHEDERSILQAIENMEKRVIDRVTALEQNLHRKMQEIEDSEGFLKLVNFQLELDLIDRTRLRGEVSEVCAPVAVLPQLIYEASVVGNCVF